MGDHPVADAPAATGVSPRRLLHEIRVDPGVTAPLGGLNPYSPHFARIGKQFHQLLIEHAGLHKNSRLLDVGCGTGRLAHPLQDFLEVDYHGFDVHPHFIDYCQKTYRKKNFKFKHVDVRHDEYNPGGTLDPAKFEFPYPSRSFDVVTAIAVFNHLHTKWVFQYVREIARVLKPKGIFLGTMLLLNQQSMEWINGRQKPPYQFSHRTPESWHDFEDRPLFNVAHPEEGIRRVFIKSNLMLREPVRYGEWCESKIALAGPDVLIARKN